MEPANSLFLFNASQLALGNEPALAAHVRQDLAFHNFFFEAAQQLFRRFARSSFDRWQPYHLPFLVDFRSAYRQAMTSHKLNPAVKKTHGKAR
jgi:hypothetical protein